MSKGAKNVALMVLIKIIYHSIILILQHILLTKHKKSILSMQKLILIITLLLSISSRYNAQSCQVKILTNYTNFNQYNPKCEGSDVDILIFPFDANKTYTWNFSSNYTGNFVGFGAHEAFGYIFGAVKTNSGWFTLTVSDSLGCTFTDSVYIAIRPVPFVLQTGVTFACIGATSVVKAIDLTSYNAPYTYSWENGETTQKINVLHAGGYSPAPTVTVTNKFGCYASNTNSQFIGTLFPDDATIVAATDTIICTNETATLKISQPLTGQIYTWKKNSVNIFGAKQQSFTTKNTGNYSLEVKSANGCKSTSQAINVQVQNPTVAISTTNPSLCNVDSVLLSSVTNSNVAYQWKRNNIEIPNTNIAEYEAVTNGRYKVIVTDSEGCTNVSNTIEVTGQNCKNGNIYNADGNEIMATLWQNKLQLTGANVEGNAHFLLHNIAGSSILRNKISLSGTTINLNDMADGIYLLNIINGVSTNVSKLVILNGEPKIYKLR